MTGDHCINQKQRSLVKLTAIILVVFLLVVLSIPFWFTQFDWVCRNFAQTGPIGDTFGGFLGPGIAIIGAALTFLAFYIQYQANQQQREEISKQAKNWEIERFENRFFELTKLHRENVQEIYLTPDINGRRVFSHLYNELKVIFYIIKDIILTRSSSMGENLDNVRPLRMAYTIFFFGYEAKADYEDSFNEDEQHIMSDVFYSLLGLSESATTALKDREESDRVFDVTFKHIPFKEHGSQLGHYYRHLFQTAKFIRDHTRISPETKKDYLRTLRAQLSDSEQLMLYFNAISWYEDDWYELFTDYKFIKNIPIEIAKLHIDPREKYRKEMVDMFLACTTDKLFEHQGNIEQFVEDELKHRLSGT